jgi:hypothetical protein
MDLDALGHSDFAINALSCDVATHLQLMLLTTLCWAGMEVGYRSIMRPGTWVIAPADLADRRAYRTERIGLAVYLTASAACVVALASKTSSSSLGALAGNIAVGFRRNWNDQTNGFLAAFAFSTLGSFQCLAAFGLYAGRPPRLAQGAVAACIALPSLAATGSRRAVIVPVVVAMLTSLSLRRFRAVATLITLMLTLLAIVIPFGQSALRLMAGETNTLRTEVRAESIVDQFGYIAMELSISQLESLSTLQRYDGPSLLGFDHWMAMARVVVKQSLFGVQLPRVTRQMTEMHSGDPETNDIPAGFVGAAWVDAGWFGFMILPVMVGGAAAIFDRWARTRKWTPGGHYCSFAIGYLLFFQTMNTGTLDFALGPTSIMTCALCAYVMASMPPKTQLRPFNPPR